MEILKTKLIWSGLCISSPSPLHRLAKQHFDELYKCKHSESFLSQPEHTIWISRHWTLTTQYLYLGVFLWKWYIVFCKLQRHSQVAKLLFMYSFTHINFHTNSLSFQAPTYWNCHPHKRLLPDEVFQWG